MSVSIIAKKGLGAASKYSNVMATRLSILSGAGLHRANGKKEKDFIFSRTFWKMRERNSFYLKFNMIIITQKELCDLCSSLSDQSGIVLCSGERYYDR